MPISSASRVPLLVQELDPTSLQTKPLSHPHKQGYLFILNTNNPCVIHIPLLLAKLCAMQFDFHTVVWSVVPEGQCWILFHGFSCDMPSLMWQWDMLLLGRVWVSSVGLLVLYILLKENSLQGYSEACFIGLKSTVLRAAQWNTNHRILGGYQKWWLSCLMLTPSQPHAGQRKKLP